MQDNFLQTGRHTGYFPLIDVTKLFCAVLVLLIHCLEVQSGHPIATFIVKCFSSQAVPFSVGAIMYL